jgi:EAL domain-containing protein (putative c-di-GMP-specific phosphodiesterase class I)
VRQEFTLHYQPQICAISGSIVGMEALIRWNHPVHGMISPDRFIGLAEEMGLIIPIGAWVLSEACIQTKAWQQAGLGDLRVAVNLSARQFTQKNLVQSIADVLHATGLEPRFLELELTESMVMNDVDNAITILRNLKGLGIHIAIDDFGTGYSSLSYLRRFPIDVLKIDQSFVNDLMVDADDAAIVVSIISLAHSLRLQVVAEGVENAEQLAFLRAHGCDQMQGYHFSRPIAADEFECLLQADQPFSTTTSFTATQAASNASAMKALLKLI